MASSFYAWSIFVIMYQTIACVIVSWLVLECRMAPTPAEPRELTLIKMMYLFDPEKCGRVFYYNFSLPALSKRTTISNILWMKNNWIAGSFRKKLQLWLSLHVTWFGLALLNASQGRRPCGFYAILLPLTAVGIALLVVDLLHAGLFLHDATHTQTEAAIWDYIGDVQQINRTESDWALELVHQIQHDDTSWIALLFVYVSIRGVVQWIINFWIVQDNYFEGLQYYRELSLEQSNKHHQPKNYEY